MISRTNIYYQCQSQSHSQKKTDQTDHKFIKDYVIIFELV